MKRFIIALQFLTVFRVKKEVEVTKEDLAASMSYFPLVGAVQGTVLVISSYLLSGLLPGNVVAGIAILLLALTNGGLHLDGFADTVDGLAGGKTEEERLRIMRDSSTGAIGVAFVAILILLKYLALSEMPLEAQRPALFMFPVMGRWAMVPMARWSRYARDDEGLGAAFAGNTNATFIAATAIGAILLALAMGIISLLIMLLLGAAVYAFSVFFRKKLGGVTGDVFGFQSEVAEVLFLVLVLALTRILDTQQFI